MSSDFLTHDKATRTDMYCHACSNNFVAELDYQLDGNHAIQCPFCSHLHYRIIKEGRVTGDRYDSDHGSADKSYKALRTWKSDSRAIQTSIGSHFMRERWLERFKGHH